MRDCSRPSAQAATASRCSAREVIPPVAGVGRDIDPPSWPKVAAGAASGVFGDRATPPDRGGPDFGDLPDDVAGFVALLLVGARQRALVVCRAGLARGRGSVDLSVRLIQPALYEIGRRWEQHRITVAQEHRATAICQHILAVMLADAKAPRRLSGRVLLACVEGNQHSVGLQMVADAIEAAGWGADFLGADVPTPDLLRAVLRTRPHLIAISASMSCHVTAVIRAIGVIRQRFPTQPPTIAVGGRAFAGLVDPAGTVGADLFFADARAVATAFTEVGAALAAHPAPLRPTSGGASVHLRPATARVNAGRGRARRR